MTTIDREALSAKFDLYYNNITSNRAPGLSEYEKSSFMTDALHLIVRDAYSGTSGPFEITEEVTEYLQKLVRQLDYIPLTENVNIPVSENEPKVMRLKQTDSLFGGIYTEYATVGLPDEMWFIVFEKALIGGGETCAGLKNALVSPTTHNELYKKIENPFRGPDERTVLRTISNDAIELYSVKPLSVYSVRYLKDPGMIHLASFNQDENNPDAPSNWTFNAADDTATDALNDIPDSLIDVILYKAVELAKAAWQ